jgi:hypothetical protein
MFAFSFAWRQHRPAEPRSVDALTSRLGIGTAGKYSNLTVRHRPRTTNEGLRPASTTTIDLRATRSHRGGHWFDPSIAHQVRGYVDLHQAYDGSRSCSQVVSEPVRCRPWRAGVAGAKTASTLITRGSVATLRPIGIVRAAGVALSVSSPAPTVGGARKSPARTRPRSGHAVDILLAGSFATYSTNAAIAALTLSSSGAFT